MQDTAKPQTRAARLFTDHPATVGETYFGHMRFALCFSGMMAMAAGAALIHAALPFVFETTASDLLKRMNARIAARH